MTPTHEDQGTGYDPHATGHELQGRQTAPEEADLPSEDEDDDTDLNDEDDFPFDEDEEDDDPDAEDFDGDLDNLMGEG